MKKWLYLMLLTAAISSCTYEQKDPYKLIKRPLQTNTQISIRSIQAFDDSTIWATGNGGTILKSFDAGESWDVMTIPGHESSDFRDLQLFGKKKAIVMSIGSPAKIFRTKNGGKSWWLTYFNEDPDIFLDGMTFLNDEIGVAFGDAIGTRIPIIRTINGGNSWEMLDEMDLPLALPKEGGFAASGTSIRSLNDSTVVIGMGYPRGRVLRSTDRGLTWEFYLSHLGNNENSRGIYSMAFKKNSNESKTMIGLAVGGSWEEPNNDNLVLSRSEDGGIHWSIIAENAPTGYRSAVDFAPDKNLAICTGNNGTDMSFDGGVTWKSFSKDGFNAIGFTPSGKYAYLAGNNGKISRVSFLEQK
ncbi:MAG: photosystem II stability/assembly factor-like uncharacterized protein [Salibacteraceae bacterium]|jgi:photosystem II stability/assembly factor-like uncharacterized protein